MLVLLHAKQIKLNKLRKRQKCNAQVVQTLDSKHETIKIVVWKPVLHVHADVLIELN